MFNLGETYSKKDIYKILNVPKQNQEGPWNTGYHLYNNEFFFFVNIETEGATGHNYNNTWDQEGNLLTKGKNGSHIGQPQMKKIINNNLKYHFFVREDRYHPFTYEGLGKLVSYNQTSPVEFKWDLNSASDFSIAEQLKDNENLVYPEGGKKTITVNAYERNTHARNACIEHHGVSCTVCGFNFEEVYGELGKGFIHVHHIKPISEIGDEYTIDPINDLVPVCPNCHAMIHKNTPILSIEKIKDFLCN